MSRQTEPSNAPPFSAQASLLSDAFHNALADLGDDRCYLMYDQTLGLPSDDEAVADWAQTRNAWIEVPVRHQQVDRSMWPLWLPIDIQTARGSQVVLSSISASLQEASPAELCSGRGRRIGGWLTLHAGSELHQAATRFGRSMLQLSPQGRAALLRLCDPAVIWALWALLDSQQRSSLLGSIRYLWVLDPAGRFCKLEATHVSTDVLVLRRDQWRDVALIQPLNQALVAWLGGRSPEQNDHLALGRARDTAMFALRRGVTHGLADCADLATFARHAMTIHSRFDEHSVVQELLRRRREDDEHYTSVVEVLTEADWRRISDDLRDVACQ